MIQNRKTGVDLLIKRDCSYEEIRLEKIVFPVVREEQGFGYIKSPAQNYDGIQDVRKIETAGLDIDGTDANEIMSAAEAAETVMQTG